MVTTSVLAGIASEVTAESILAALNAQYTLLGSQATANKQDLAQASLTAIAASLASPVLATGAATAARQDSAQVSLTAIAASVATPPLPSGSATAGKQDTGNTSLASIDGKTPALVSGASPVSLPAAQVTALTPPAAITGYSTEVTLASLRDQQAIGGRGVRRDTDDTPVSDGGSHPLYTNQVGRLKVSAWPGAYAAVTGNITANGQTVTVDVARASNLTVYCTGTFSTVNVAFEGSLDNTNWFSLTAARTNANTAETATGNLSAAPAYAWEVSVNGYMWFRVRATAFTSGTQVWTMVRGAYATEPAPVIQTHPVTASGNFPVTIAATVVTQEAGAATLTGVTQVATSTTSVQLAASLATRKSVTIYNSATVNLLVNFAATASATAFVTQIVPNGVLVVDREQWTGIITGVLASGAASTANVTVTSP